MNNKILIIILTLIVNLILAMNLFANIPMGTVVNIQGDVKVRQNNESAWNDLTIGESIYLIDSFITYAKSELKILLNNDITIIIYPNTIVNLNKSENQELKFEIKVWYGDLRISFGNNSDSKADFNLVTPSNKFEIFKSDFVINSNETGEFCIAVNKGLIRLKNNTGIIDIPQNYYLDSSNKNKIEPINPVNIKKLTDLDSEISDTLNITSYKTVKFDNLPADNSIVKNNLLILTGTGPEDSNIRINDFEVTINNYGNLRHFLFLDEGKNIINIEVNGFLICSPITVYVDTQKPQIRYNKRIVNNELVLEGITEPKSKIVINDNDTYLVKSDTGYFNIGCSYDNKYNKLKVIVIDKAGWITVVNDKITDDLFTNIYRINNIIFQDKIYVPGDKISIRIYFNKQLRFIDKIYMNIVNETNNFYEKIKLENSMRHYLMSEIEVKNYFPGGIYKINSIELYDNNGNQYKINTNKLFQVENKPPEKIHGVQVENVPGSQETKISWSKNTESDIDKYLVYRKNNYYEDFKVIGQTETNYYLDTAIKYDESYKYKICAVDYLKQPGIFSDPVEIVTKNMTVIPVPDITESYINNKGNVFLKWTINKNNSKSNFIESDKDEYSFEILLKQNEKIVPIGFTNRKYFIHTNINNKGNKSYTYYVVCIDKNNPVKKSDFSLPAVINIQ